MRIRTLALVLSCWLASAAAGSAQPADDVVLFQFAAPSRHALNTYESGFVRRFQSALNGALRACGLAAGPETGRFNATASAAVVRLASCAQHAAAFPSDGAERRGAVTPRLWSALLPAEPVPNAAERAAGLVLSYEATDYTDTRFLWNFCQNRPAYDPAAEGSVCHSNDKTSFLTWGPRGATAGHGREVQAILELVRLDAPELIAASFAGEEAAVLRMLRLENANPQRRDTSLEAYLCGVWMDPARRSAWRDGFSRLGAHARVQAHYQAYYRTRSSDGGKIEAYQALYRASGVSMSEVDYAFVLDRVTHMSAPSARVRRAIADTWALVPAEERTNARFRQIVSVTYEPRNLGQLASRRTRDVAFFIDDLPRPLWSEEQRNAWDGASGQAIAASAAGLSDARAGPEFSIADAPAGVPPAADETLSAEERALCPAAVLNPVSPP